MAAKKSTAAPTPKPARAKAAAPASKRKTVEPQLKGAPKAEDAGGLLGFRHRPTELPGVYLNAYGHKVDKDGVLISLRAAKEAESELIEELGDPPQSPAEFLKRTALNPALPLHTRMSAAIAAAPYFDRKMPLGLEGSGAGQPIRTESHSAVISNLQALPLAERKAALALLEKLGVLG